MRNLPITLADGWQRIGALLDTATYTQERRVTALDVLNLDGAKTLKVAETGNKETAATDGYPIAANGQKSFDTSGGRAIDLDATWIFSSAGSHNIILTFHPK